MDYLIYIYRKKSRFISSYRSFIFKNVHYLIFEIFFLFFFFLIYKQVGKQVGRQEVTGTGTGTGTGPLFIFGK